MSSIKQNGFEKSAAKKPAPKITIDLRLKTAAGNMLHCFSEKNKTGEADGSSLKMSIFVSEKNISDPRLSSVLDAFELRVEIRFPV
jgi:hypothetical protein